MKKQNKKMFFAALFICILAGLTSNSCIVVNAATGASVIHSGMSTLTDIAIALVSSIGEVVVLWGIFEMGTAMQSSEGSMQSNSFKRIGGGVTMLLAPQLLSAFTK